MKESTIQQQIIQRFSFLAAEYNFVYFAPMNETAMSCFKAFKVPDKISYPMYQWLLKMGFLPGTSDLIIFHNEKAYCMEIKTQTGEQSKSQVLFMKNILKTGIDYAVVRSLDQAVECLRVWGIVK